MNDDHIYIMLITQLTEALAAMERDRNFWRDAYDKERSKKNADADTGDD